MHFLGLNNDTYLCSNVIFPMGFFLYWQFGGEEIFPKVIMQANKLF